MDDGSSHSDRDALLAASAVTPPPQSRMSRPPPPAASLPGAAAVPPSSHDVEAGMSGTAAETLPVPTRGYQPPSVGGGPPAPVAAETAPEEEEEDEDDGGYSADHLSAVLRPVALTMILASAAVGYIREPAQDAAISSGLGNYLVYNQGGSSGGGGGGSSGEQIGQALVNAIVIVSVICAATFVLVLCYYFRCIKLMVAYLIFASVNLLGYSGGFMVVTAITVYRGIVDWPTLVFVMYNFAIAGAVAVFWQKGIPRIVTKGYLVLVSVIMSWIVTKLPEWTAWALLVMLALYDLCAVLTPCGPLRALIALAQVRRDPIPGLLYEADVGTSGADRPRDTFVTNRGAVGPPLTGADRQSGPAATSAAAAGPHDSRPAAPALRVQTAAPIAASAHTPSRSPHGPSSPAGYTMVDMSSRRSANGRGAPPPADADAAAAAAPSSSTAGVRVSSLSALPINRVMVGAATAPTVAARGDDGADSYSALPDRAAPSVPATATAALGGSSNGGFGDAAAAPHRRAATTSPSHGVSDVAAVRVGGRTVHGAHRPLQTEVGILSETAIAAGAGVANHPHPYHRTGHDADNDASPSVVKPPRSTGSGGGASPAGGPTVGAARSGGDGAPHVSPTQGEGGDDGGGEGDRSIKLGLGDFVFYSVLVSRAALFDVSTMAACFVAVIMGLGSTLFLLGIMKKALPALPISIFLGVAFYFLTRLVVTPFIVEMSLNAVGI